MIKFLVAPAFGILDFCVLDFKSSKRCDESKGGICLGMMVAKLDDMMRVCFRGDDLREGWP